MTVARAFLRAASRMPSARAAFWSWSWALARVLDSRFWSAGMSRPVSRGVDAGVLVVERGDEELRRRQGDLDAAHAAGLGHVDVLGLELAEVDAGDGLAMDDEQDFVHGEGVGQDGEGRGRDDAFDDGIGRIDDGLQAGEALDLRDDDRDGGVVGGARGDERGEARGDSGAGVAEEDDDAGGSEDERQKKGKERSGGAAGVVLSRHAGVAPSSLCGSGKLEAVYGLNHTAP